MSRTSLYGFLALVFAALIFASFGVYIRILSKDLDTYQQIFFRGLLGFIIASTFSIGLRKKIQVGHISKKILLSYIVFFPVVVILFTFSILLTKLSTTLFGFYIGTFIFSLFIGIKFFNEKLTSTKKLALSIALAGLFLYTFPLSPSTFNLGLVLAVIAGSLDAVSNALRKFLTGKVDKLILIVLQVFGMAIISIPFVLFSLDSGVPSISAVSWIVGLWFGLMLVAVNYLLLYGFSHFDLNLGSIVLSSELFFATLIGFLIYQESVTQTETIGIILIVIAMASTNLDGKVIENTIKKLRLTKIFTNTE